MVTERKVSKTYILFHVNNKRKFKVSISDTISGLKIVQY